MQNEKETLMETEVEMEEKDKWMKMEEEKAA